jgi:hypothetical protein
MLDEFYKVQATLPKGGHRFWWDDCDLTVEQRDAVVEALSRPDLSDRTVTIILNQWGVKVTKSQVSHLRRKLSDG